MKLYKLSQDINSNYDTYDSMVVSAIDETDAKNIHPNNDVYLRDDKWYNLSLIDTEIEWDDSESGFCQWLNRKDIDKIKVEYLGETEKERGVILYSFNAG